MKYIFKTYAVIWIGLCLCIPLKKGFAFDIESSEIHTINNSHVQSMDSIILDFKIGLCNDNLESFLINAQWSGGVAPYTFMGDTIPNNFTFPPTPNGEEYSFLILDSEGNELIIDGSVTCFCVNFAGTMGRDTLIGCKDEDIFATYNNDASLDGNDVEIYIVHDSNADTLGNIIGVYESNRIFYNSNFVFDSVVFVSHVIANESIYGGLDLNDACLKIAPGQPIMIRRDHACNCPNISFDMNDVSCFGEDDGTLELLVDSDEDFRLTINEEDLGNTSSITNLSAQNVTLVYESETCLDTFQFEIQSPPKIDVDIGNQIQVAIDETVVIEAITNLHIDSISTIIWGKSDGIIDSDGLILETSFAMNDQVTVTITDTYGCMTTSRVDIGIVLPDIVLPTIIRQSSLIGNEVFDVRMVVGLQDGIDFQVFDRYGSLVYDISNASRDDEALTWRGEFNNNILASSVYVYKIQGMRNGIEFTHVGDITILR